MHTLLEKFLFLYLRLSGCAGCASSPACIGWWYASAGLVPPICLDLLHDHSPAHVQPGRMLGHPLSSRPVGAHSLAASGIFLSGQCTLSGTPHTRWNTQLLSILPLGLGLLGVLASSGEFSGGNTTMPFVHQVANHSRREEQSQWFPRR